MTVKHFCSHQNLSEKDIQVIINDLKICEITCTLYLRERIFLLLLEEMSLKFSVKKKLLHKYCYYFWTYQYIVFCQESLLFWQLYSLSVNCSFCENEKLVITGVVYAFFLYWNFGRDKLICGLFFMNSKRCEKKIFIFDKKKLFSVPFNEWNYFVKISTIQLFESVT